MVITLTHQQMLQTWRRCAGLEPSVSACTIERFDGVDVDRRLGEMMRQWYLRLLDEGDPAMLGPAEDVSGLVSAAADGRLAVDASVRRLCTVRLSGWEREATVATAEEAARAVELLANPYSRAGNERPIAWRGEGGAIRAAPVGDGAVVTAAKGYIDTGADAYRIDERALATIPTSFSIL